MCEREANRGGGRSNRHDVIWESRERKEEEGKAVDEKGLERF
jgi:hypothetical protein